jgi:hypothetical protein
MGKEITLPGDQASRQSMLKHDIIPEIKYLMFLK